MNTLLRLLDWYPWTTSAIIGLGILGLWALVFHILEQGVMP